MSFSMCVYTHTHKCPYIVHLSAIPGAKRVVLYSSSVWLTDAANGDAPERGPPLGKSGRRFVIEHHKSFVEFYAGKGDEFVTENQRT